MTGAARLAGLGTTIFTVLIRFGATEGIAAAPRAAIGPRAKVLLLNTPRNPTGRVLYDDQQAAPTLARFAFRKRHR